MCKVSRKSFRAAVSFFMSAGEGGSQHDKTFRTSVSLSERIYADIPPSSAGDSNHLLDSSKDGDADAT